MMIRRRMVAVAAIAMAATASLLLSAGTAHAVTPWTAKGTHWYASRASIHSEASAGRTTCIYGNAWDKAGMNKKYNVTGKIWERSIARKVFIQKKTGKKWKTLKSVWTDNDYGFNYGTCFKAEDGKYRAHLAIYYPYNTTAIRAHSANSKTITIR